MEKRLLRENENKRDDPKIRIVHDCASLEKQHQPNTNFFLFSCRRRKTWHRVDCQFVRLLEECLVSKTCQKRKQARNFTSSAKDNSYAPTRASGTELARMSHWKRFVDEERGVEEGVGITTFHENFSVFLVSGQDTLKTCSSKSREVLLVELLLASRQLCICSWFAFLSPFHLFAFHPFFFFFLLSLTLFFVCLHRIVEYEFGWLSCWITAKISSFISVHRNICFVSLVIRATTMEPKAARTSVTSVNQGAGAPVGIG